MISRLFLSLAVLSVCVAFTQGTFRFQRPKGCEKDVVLSMKTGLITEMSVRSKTECAYRCGENPDCIGFNYEDITNTTKTCQLLSEKSDMYASFITTRQGFAYYERTQDPDTDPIGESPDTCSWIDDTNQCPEGWVRYKDSCYLFYTEQNMNFANSQSKCREYGAHLVAITTEDENTFLVNYIEEHFDPSSIAIGYGTGANDIGIERKWVWDYYGTLVENGFQYWKDSEGTGRLDTNENCMKISKDDRKWYDYPVTGQDSPFICEMDIRPNPTLFEVLDQKRVTHNDYDFLAVKVRISENETCPSGDCCLEYKKLCQHLGPFKPTGCSRPHITAAMTDYERCETTYNADINIEDTLGCNPSSQIKEIANAAFGGGADDGNSFGTTICSEAKCTDKLSTTTSNQGLNRLDTALSSQDRIAYTVCREDNGQCSCPSGYHMHGCSCYKFVTELVNFDTARSRCQAHCVGCDLTAIEDVDENTYIRETIINTPSYSSANKFWFIDGYDPNANNGYYYKSKNDASLTYTDWQDGQPNDGNARCIALWPSYSYHWADEGCGNGFYYVCEVNLRSRGCTCPSS